MLDTGRYANEGHAGKLNGECCILTRLSSHDSPSDARLTGIQTVSLIDDSKRLKGNPGLYARWKDIEVRLLGYDADDVPILNVAGALSAMKGAGNRGEAERERSPKAVVE